MARLCGRLRAAVAYFYLGVMDRLGADPLKVLERELGEWALRLLIAGLTITPLRQVLGINLLRYRRAIGLLAFSCVVLHLCLRRARPGLDWAAIFADIVKRPYITVGMASFVLLVPLAATSNNASIRRLGGQAWARLQARLHRRCGRGPALCPAREVLAAGALGLCRNRRRAARLPARAAAETATEVQARAGLEAWSGAASRVSGRARALGTRPRPRPPPVLARRSRAAAMASAPVDLKRTRGGRTPWVRSTRRIDGPAPAM